MTLKPLGQGHRNLLNSEACLNDMYANSEKMHPLLQKIQTWNQNSAESGVAPAPHSIPIPTKR